MSFHSEISILQLSEREPIGEGNPLIHSGNYEDFLRSPLASTVLNSSSITELKQLDSAIEESVHCYANNSTQDNQDAGCLTVLNVAVSCLQLYIQNNWTGPVTEVPPFTFLQWIPEQKYEEVDVVVQDMLSMDGEPAYGLSRHPLYLLIARTILLNCRDILKDCQTADIWLMRCMQIHQNLFKERMPILKATVMDLISQIQIKEPLMTDERFRSSQIQFHLEAGHLCYFYYEPSEASGHFNQARKISGLTINPTGVMGKRTKFQEKFLAQLVLKVTREGETSQGLDQNIEELPKNISLDDETVLNNIAVEEEDPALDTQVSALEQALLLALCHHHKKHSDSHGDILKEECLAFINKILLQPQNWSVQSMALLMRTYWESESPRRLERTMAQLEELVNQIKTESSCPAKRTHLVYCSRWQPIWHLRKELAELLLKIGLKKSALDIFLSLEMWEDVINCYKLLGRTEAAEKLIRAQLVEKETPALWCHLGNVLNDPECYRKAWELSDHHYGNAQKQLAYYHLRKGEFEESLPCFAKAVEINPLLVAVWFSYGCAAMAMKDWKLAGKAFRRCVSIETQNFEAWSNLASVYIKSNQKARAFTAMQEALKCEYENWRLWENFLLLSTDVGEFLEAIRAYHRLLDLRDKHDDGEVLTILVKAVTMDMKDASGLPASTYRPKLLELFGRVTSKVTSSWVIWKQYANLLTNGIEVISNDDRHKALQYLQKCHRCLTQEANWEKDVARCQETIKESVDLSQQFQSLTKDLEDKRQAAQFLSSARLMMNGTLTKITKQHTDPAIGALFEDLIDPCKALETQVRNITQLATTMREDP